MSKRSMGEIQREYVQQCAGLGELVYRADQLKKQLSDMNDKRNSINQAIEKLAKEASALQQAELSKAPEAPAESSEAVPAPEPSPAPETQP